MIYLCFTRDEKALNEAKERRYSQEKNKRTRIDPFVIVSMLKRKAIILRFAPIIDHDVSSPLNRPNFQICLSPLPRTSFKLRLRRYVNFIHDASYNQASVQV